MNRAMQYHPTWVMVVGMIVSLMLANGPVLAASNGIAYQGTLADPSGNATPDGNYPMTFSVWDGLAGGSKLWEETGHTVNVTKGTFAVELGLTTSFGMMFDTGASRWLEVSANLGSGLQTFTPRVPFAMVPFARKAAKAGDADLLDGLDSLAFALKVHDHVWSEIGNVPATFTPSAHNHSGANITSGKVSNAYLNTGPGGGMDADMLDGTHASGFAVSGHNHSGANITSGKVGNAYLNTGAGGGLDADLLDGVHAIQFAPSMHTHLGADITSGKVGNAYLNTGAGGGLDADLLDGTHASAFAPLSHNHSGANITSGKVDNAYLNTGAGNGLNADQVDGVHAASFWNALGNAGTVSATNFLGTTDNVALNLRVNNLRALRIEPNATSPNLIGGFNGNSVTAGAYGASIGGGGSSDNTNTVTDAYGVVGGGQLNQAGDGALTQEDRMYATVGGGYGNTASGTTATVAGGDSNTASLSGATVGGGGTNNASANYTTVGGGNLNTASGDWATVGGGQNNSASGDRATVPGGYSNTASGSYSFAAGRSAKAPYSGCFTWVDSSGTVTDSTSTNQFRVRSTGGVWFFSGTGSGNGVTLASGSGTWTSLSDRNAKENFAPVDAGEVLDKVAALPVTTWNYKEQDTAIRHVGPMAQDMYAAFGVGETDTGITTVDADGVALAAIQGLNQRLKEGMEEKDREIAQLRAEMNELKALVNAMAAK